MSQPKKSRSHQFRIPAMARGGQRKRKTLTDPGAVAHEIGDINRRCSADVGAAADETSVIVTCSAGVREGAMSVEHKRRAVDYLLEGESVRTNRHLQRFAAAPYLHSLLCEPKLDSMWRRQSKSLRKELIEGYALIESLQSVQADAPSVIVDLCCGKGFASVLMAHEFPRALILMFDANTAIKPNAAALSNVHFHTADIFDGGFATKLRSLIDAALRERLSSPRTLRCVAVGMHLCGSLSPRAIELFEQTDLLDGLVLAPCCLHKIEDAPYAATEPSTPFVCVGISVNAAGFLSSRLKQSARAARIDPFEAKVADLLARCRPVPHRPLNTLRSLPITRSGSMYALRWHELNRRMRVRTPLCRRLHGVSATEIRDPFMRTNSGGAETEGSVGVKNVLIVAVRTSSVGAAATSNSALEGPAEHTRARASSESVACLRSTSCSSSAGSAIAVVEQLRLVLGGAGFDVLAPFSTLWYNELVAEQALPVVPLPTFGRSGGALGVLVANTRGLWAPFVRHCAKLRSSDAASDTDAPADLLDEYCERHVRSAASAVAAAGMSVSCHFVFETDAPRLVAMQRVAVLCGLCSLDSASHLCVHAEYGPWISLRAVIVLDLEPPQSRPPLAPDLVSADESAAAEVAVAAAIAAGLESGENRDGSPEVSMLRSNTWRSWLRVRDAISVGREHRFGDDQLEYHYSAHTRRAALRRAMVASESELAAITQE